MRASVLEGATQWLRTTSDDAAPAGRRQTAATAGRQADDSLRTYVLDTSVLLADPGAMLRFDEHEVVLPVVVITELEAKRDHPELGYFARAALRRLDELRVRHGRLDRPVPIGDLGGTLRVELNHTDAQSLPSGFRLGDNDTRILAVARNLADEGAVVTLVSKDLPLRIKASAVGLDAEEYRAELAVESGWTGMVELEVPSADLDDVVRRGTPRPGGGPGAALPHRAGAALRPWQCPRAGAARQERPAHPGGPRGLRPARPLRRAAGRARPAARSRGRHRLPRRSCRHRQVGVGAVRRASRR